MKQLILEKLREIETTHQVKILFACEAGSRAWGFHSDGSDFDVRFVYIHRMDYYLSLLDRDEAMNFGVNQQLDISGWDLRKFLQLMAKSNASVIEWMRSPEIYMSEPVFHNESLKLVVDYFNPIAAFHHYEGLAAKYLEDISQSGPTVKGYLHAARALLAMEAILKTENPPMVMMEDLMLFIEDMTMYGEIRKLFLIKRSGATEEIPNKVRLGKWMRDSFERCRARKSNLKHQKISIGRLDDFFRQMIHQFGG